MLIKCRPCNGKGVRSQYGHVANGRCFYCNGKGMIAKTVKKARKGNFSVDEINELMAAGKIGKV